MEVMASAPGSPSSSCAQNSDLTMPCVTTLSETIRKAVTPGSPVIHSLCMDPSGFVPISLVLKLPEVQTFGCTREEVLDSLSRSENFELAQDQSAIKLKAESEANLISPTDHTAVGIQYFDQATWGMHNLKLNEDLSAVPLVPVDAVFPFSPVYPHAQFEWYMDTPANHRRRNKGQMRAKKRSRDYDANVPDSMTMKEWLKVIRLHKYTDLLESYTRYDLLMMSDEELCKMPITDGARRKLRTDLARWAIAKNIEVPYTTPSPTFPLHVRHDSGIGDEKYVEIVV